MAKISTYPLASGLSFSDMLIGTDAENDNATKNFSIGDVYSLFYNENPPAAASYYNMDTVQANTANFPYTLPFPNEIFSQGGISIGGLQNSIVIANPGVYMINLTARFVHTGGGGDAVTYFYLREYSTNIDFSRQEFTIPNTHTQVVDYSFLLNVSSGSTYLISWVTNNLNLKLIPDPSTAFAPQAPSILLNVYKVAPYIS